MRPWCRAGSSTGVGTVNDGDKVGSFLRVGFGQSRVRYPADLQRPDLFFCFGCSLAGVSSSELEYSTSPTDARFIQWPVSQVPSEQAVLKRETP
jgi:hypothetical protein